MSTFQRQLELPCLHATRQKVTAARLLPQTVAKRCRPRNLQLPALLQNEIEPAGGFSPFSFPISFSRVTLTLTKSARALLNATSMEKPFSRNPRRSPLRQALRRRRRTHRGQRFERGHFIIPFFYVREKNTPQQRTLPRRTCAEASAWRCRPRLQRRLRPAAAQAPRRLPAAEALPPRGRAA